MDEIRRQLTRMADKHVREPELNAAVKHLLGRGKLYRPRLALATYEALTGSDATEHVLAVIPLELIHTFTLIHDDLPCMDDASLRRGIPAVHVEFGEALAVLAGDALCNLAFQVLTDPEQNLKPEIVLQLVSTLSRATQEIVEGQVLDLSGQNKQFSLTELGEMQRKKTGALLSACGGFGAILSGADEWLVSNLQLGPFLGGLFQMRDDLLAAEGDQSITGKSSTDEILKKSTFVSLLGLDEAKQRADQLESYLLEAVNNLQLSDPEPLLLMVREANNREH